MIKSIVKNYAQLRKVCDKVEPKEDIRQIIQDLKDTLEATNGKGVGLSANQIGYNKKICYIKMPVKKEGNKIINEELIMINPEIIEKTKPIAVKEECLSFPGLQVVVKRFVFTAVTFENEKREPCMKLLQDFYAFAVQHETDHCNSLTILERKFRNTNT